MKFLVTIKQDDEGFFVVQCPSLPGCVSQGQTEREALENIQDAIRGCWEARTMLA
jgi:predicted RNase H-like HicB family nuclease